MAQEEQNLKKYFKEFKKPIEQDPTKISTLIQNVVRSESAANDRIMIFKQALKPFQLPYTFYQFWNMECATPEENRTLQLCKKVTTKV